MDKAYIIYKSNFAFNIAANEITAYIGTDSNVKIPSSIGSMNVKGSVKMLFIFAKSSKALLFQTA